MITHINFHNEISIHAPINELNTVKDVVDCVRDFGSFDVSLTHTSAKVYARCTPTTNISCDDARMILEQAIQTVTGENF